MCAKVENKEIISDAERKLSRDIAELCLALVRYCKHINISEKEKGKVGLLLRLIMQTPIQDWDAGNIYALSSLQDLGIFVSSANCGTLEVKDGFYMFGDSRHTFIRYDKDGIFVSSPILGVSCSDVYYVPGDSSQVLIRSNGRDINLYTNCNEAIGCNENVKPIQLQFPDSHDKFNRLSFYSRDAVLSAVQACENMNAVKSRSRIRMTSITSPCCMKRLKKSYILKPSVHSDSVTKNSDNHSFLLSAKTLCDFSSQRIISILSESKDGSDFVGDKEIFEASHDLSLFLQLKYYETNGYFKFSFPSDFTELFESFKTTSLSNVIGNSRFEIIFDSNHVSLLVYKNEPGYYGHFEYPICSIDGRKIMMCSGRKTHLSMPFERPDPDKDKDAVFNGGDTGYVAQR